MKKVTIFSLLLLILFLVNWALTASAFASPTLGSARVSFGFCVVGTDEKIESAVSGERLRHGCVEF